MTFYLQQIPQFDGQPGRLFIDSTLHKGAVAVEEAEADTWRDAREALAV